MEKKVIFIDEERIEAEMKTPREDAAKLQRLLDLIGDVKTPPYEQKTKTGLRLLKDLVNRHNATDYLASVMVNRKNENVLREAIADIEFSVNGKRMDLDLFILNDSGRVEAIGERRVIERHTYYVENELQAEYIEKAQALADAWNTLETFLQDHNQPDIQSNWTQGYNIERLEYEFRDFAKKGYSNMKVNLRVVNDFK